MNVFYINYANALHISRSGISIVMMMQYVGWILSMFTSTINNKFCISSRIVSAVYVLLDGVFALLFITPIVIDNNLFVNNWQSWQTILYCSCIWFLFGIAYPTNKSAVVGMAAQFSLESEKGRNISYIGLSWAFATLIFVPIGFMIDYVDWWLPFLSLGTFCIIASPIVLYTFPSHHHHQSQSGSQQKSQSQSSRSRELYLIFCKSKVCILILWSHTFSALACGSIETAISGPWLQDVYNFSISECGYIGFIIFGGEIVGTLMIAFGSDKFGVWIFAIISYCIFLFCAVLICIMSLAFGNAAGGLYIPFFVNFIYFVGWKIFWSALQVAIAKYSENYIQNRTIFSANHSMTAVGRIPGVLLTTQLWDHGNGITLLSCIWIGAIVISSLFWIALYYVTHQHIQDDDNSERAQLSRELSSTN